MCIRDRQNDSYILLYLCIFCVNVEISLPFVSPYSFSTWAFRTIHCSLPFQYIFDFSLYSIMNQFGRDWFCLLFNVYVELYSVVIQQNIVRKYIVERVVYSDIIPNTFCIRPNVSETRKLFLAQVHARSWNPKLTMFLDRYTTCLLYTSVQTGY